MVYYAYSMQGNETAHMPHKCSRLHDSFTKNNPFTHSPARTTLHSHIFQIQANQLPSSD